MKAISCRFKSCYPCVIESTHRRDYLECSCGSCVVDGGRDYLRRCYKHEDCYDSPLEPDEHGNFTKPSNFRKRFYRILDGAGIEYKGLHSLRHTFATNLENGVKQPDGTVKSLTPKQVGDLLGHSTSEITERYYVKRDNSRLNGITDGFEM